MSHGSFSLFFHGLLGAYAYLCLSLKQIHLNSPKIQIKFREEPAGIRNKFLLFFIFVYHYRTMYTYIILSPIVITVFVLNSIENLIFVKPAVVVYSYTHLNIILLSVNVLYYNMIIIGMFKNVSIIHII